MTSFERKIKRLFTIAFSLIMYAVVFIVTLIILTAAYSSVEKAIGARLILLVFILILAIAVVFLHIHKLKDTGRSDILTFWESFYIVSLLVCYPIKEVSLSFMIVYTICVLIGTCTILHYLDDTNINSIALYYFEYNGEKSNESKDKSTNESKDESEKIYIHYRLDDYRVVCSKDAILKQDSQRILYEITNLCQKELLQYDGFDQNWKDTVAQIRKIKEIEKDKTIKDRLAEAKAEAEAIFKSITSFLLDQYKSIKKILPKNIQKPQNEKAMVKKIWRRVRKNYRKQVKEQLKRYKEKNAKQEIERAKKIHNSFLLRIFDPAVIICFVVELVSWVLGGVALYLGYTKLLQISFCLSLISLAVLGVFAFVHEKYMKTESEIKRTEEILKEQKELWDGILEEECSEDISKERFLKLLPLYHVNPRWQIIMVTIVSVLFVTYVVYITSDFPTESSGTSILSPAFWGLVVINIIASYAGNYIQKQLSEDYYYELIKKDMILEKSND
jgi:uncharacterized membrane protein YhaH (DUF805 family)